MTTKSSNNKKRTNKRFVAVRLELHEYKTLVAQARENHRTISGEIRARIAAVSD